MAGKDFEFKGGFNENDLIKAFRYLDEKMDEAKKNVAIRINIGGFVKEFSKEFDEVDSIIDKRKSCLR